MEEIKKISIFIVAAQMLFHLCAGKQYQKYIRLLIGIMILVQLLMPVLTLCGLHGSNGYRTTLGQYEAELEQQLLVISEQYVSFTESILKEKELSYAPYSFIDMQE